MGEGEVWHCKGARRGHARAGAWRRRGRGRRRQSSVAVENHLGGGGGWSQCHVTCFTRVLMHVLTRPRRFVSLCSSRGISRQCGGYRFRHVFTGCEFFQESVSQINSSGYLQIKCHSGKRALGKMNATNKKRKQQLKALNFCCGLALGVCTRYVCTTALHVLFIITIPSP